MQLNDIALRFLNKLGYPSESIIATAIEVEEGKERRQANVFLILDRQADAVLGAVLVSATSDTEKLAAEASALSNYSDRFEHEIGEYLIAADVESQSKDIGFYEFDGDDGFVQINVDAFPSYSDLLLKYKLERGEEKRLIERRRRRSVATFAWIAALVFVLVAAADIYLEQELGLNYLNLQRVILLVAAATFLFLPLLVRGRR